MYIRELKLKNPDIPKIEESMPVGKFLAEMKDESDILVGFSIFLAEEFLQDDGNEDVENGFDSNTVLR